MAPRLGHRHSISTKIGATTNSSVSIPKWCVCVRHCQFKTISITNYLRIGHRAYHFLKTIVIVNEEHILPPVLLANVGMMSYNKVPLWSWCQIRQNICAEQDEATQCRNDTHESSNILLQQSRRLLTLQPTNNCVRCQQSAEEQENVRVYGSGTTNYGPWLTQGLVETQIFHKILQHCGTNATYLGHLRSIHVRIEKESHRLMRHHQQACVQKSNAVYGLNVTRISIQRKQSENILAQWKRY